MPPTDQWRRLALALLLGMALGLFSSRADWLPPATVLHVIVALGNAIGPWVMAGFVAGAIQGGPRRGAAGGLMALAAGVATYYVAGVLSWPGGPAALGPLVVIWLAVAIVAGLGLGAAGGGWAEGGQWRTIGPMILAGSLLAEAAYRFMEVEGWSGIDITRTQIQILAFDLLGAILVPLLLLDRRRRPVAYLGSVGLGAAGLLLIIGAESVLRVVAYW
jgi:Family of unknown function (DUF6518)